jgi:hypothetical protein
MDAWAFETMDGDDEWGTLTAVDLKARCTTCDSRRRKVW